MRMALLRPDRARDQVACALALGLSLASATAARADRFTPIPDTPNRVILSVARGNGSPEAQTAQLTDCGPLPSQLALVVDPLAGEIDVEDGTFCVADTRFFASSGELRIRVPILRAGAVPNDGPPGMGFIYGDTVALSIPVVVSASLTSYGFENGRHTAMAVVDLEGELALSPSHTRRLVHLAGKVPFTFPIGAATYTVVADVLLNLEGTEEASDMLFADSFELGGLRRWDDVFGDLP